MMRTATLRTATCLIHFVALAAGASACTSNAPTQDAAQDTTVDATVDATLDAALDAHAETGVDSATRDGDAHDTTAPRDVADTHVADTGVNFSIPLATVVNPSALGHPAPNTVVTVADNLVALTPRFFISQSSTTHKCLFGAWLGTSRGGTYAGIEVVESILPASGATDCFGPPATVGLIPGDLAIGDLIVGLHGEYENYCQSGTTCPTGAAAEILVSAASGSVFNRTSTGATLPHPTEVDIPSINASGSAGPLDIPLQNTLVSVRDAILQIAPTTTNHNVMSVTQSTAAGAPVQLVDVSKFIGVTAVRTTLQALPPGTAIGDLDGVLTYSFGQWVIQLRQRADIPGLPAPPAPPTTDAGTGTDAGTDSGTTTPAHVVNCAHAIDPTWCTCSPADSNTGATTINGLCTSDQSFAPMICCADPNFPAAGSCSCYLTQPWRCLSFNSGTAFASCDCSFYALAGVPTTSVCNNTPDASGPWRCCDDHRGDCTCTANGAPCQTGETEVTDCTNFAALGYANSMSSCPSGMNTSLSCAGAPAGTCSTDAECPGGCTGDSPACCASCLSSPAPNHCGQVCCDPTTGSCF